MHGANCDAIVSKGPIVTEVGVVEPACFQRRKGTLGDHGFDAAEHGNVAGCKEGRNRPT